MCFLYLCPYSCCSIWSSRSCPLVFRPVAVISDFFCGVIKMNKVPYIKKIKWEVFTILNVVKFFRCHRNWVHAFTDIHEQPFPWQPPRCCFSNPNCIPAILWQESKGAPVFCGLRGVQFIPWWNIWSHANMCKLLPTKICHHVTYIGFKCDY